MAGGVAALFHPVIAVSDMDTAVHFYRDLLGLRVTFDDYHDPAAISMLFDIREPVVHAVVVSCPDGSEIELVEFEHPRRPTARRDPGQPGVMAVNLLVHGVDAIVERLRAAGYEPSSPIVPQTLPDGGGIKVVVCRAPDDVAILLVELPPGRTSLAAPAEPAADVAGDAGARS
jgi:catechol 2,3-dioxygenase-like lactoylglutathione lyase family enzyme